MSKFLFNLAAIFLFFCTASYSQSLDKDQLINSLKNSANTGSSSEPLDVERLRQNLRNGVTVEGSPSNSDRKLPSDSRREVSLATSQRPSVNILIFFDYNSSNIKPESLSDLMTLGSALNSEQLFGQRFLVAGHTDAAGGREYNLKLSERRSESVVRFLNAAFPGLTGRLVPVGFGMEQLKEPSSPLSAANRRVQVLNIGN